MSRSNPYKRKKRKAKETILIYGEGVSEKIFLEYLKSLYIPDGVAIKIRNGKGGSPASIVLDAINEWGAFDKKIVVLDNDKSKKEINSAELLANKNKIKIIKNNPCLEATLLAILENKICNSKSSMWYKKEFENKYINKKKRGILSEYSKIFSKKKIEIVRKNIKELDQLILAIENKNEQYSKI